MWRSVECALYGKNGTRTVVNSSQCLDDPSMIETIEMCNENNPCQGMLRINLFSGSWHGTWTQGWSRSQAMRSGLETSGSESTVNMGGFEGGARGGRCPHFERVFKIFNLLIFFLLVSPSPLLRPLQYLWVKFSVLALLSFLAPPLISKLIF